MVDQYEVKISPHASQSLTQIIDYLKQTASRAVARKVYFGLIQEARSLEKMPHRKPIESSISDESATYRFVIKWNYKIVFYINEKARQVEVIDIFYSRRNPQKLIDLIQGE